MAGGHQLSLFETEALARDLRRRAKVDDDEVVASESIARRLLGPRAVQRIRRFSARGVISPIRGEYRIFLRAGAPDENFTIAHELGHWALRLAQYPSSGEDEERNANAIGAAIVASPVATRRAHQHFGEQLGAIAKAFDSTQSFAVLRLAEVLGDERALVARDNTVRIRSSGAFRWPELDEVCRWKAGRVPRGIQRATLRGSYDRGRVAFRAA